MNRDIIKEFDIKYRVNGVTNETEPYINLKVEIDDKDFDDQHGAYIEDIKLYNQDTFVNPTNQNSGISIFDDILHSENKDKHKKVILFDDIVYPTKLTTGFFIKDEVDVYDSSEHYYLNSSLWFTTERVFSATGGTYTLKDVYWLNDEVYTKVTSTQINTWTNNSVDITKIDFFELKTKTRVYEIKDLQDDPSFTQNFNISDDIIIVSVKIHPHPNDTCQSDYVIKAIYNKAVFKKDIIMAIGEIADRCVIPMRLIDLFLRYKAFDVAIEVGDVEYICRLFKIFKHAKGFNNAIEYAPCGCLKH